jgi:hypothetical protein
VGGGAAAREVGSLRKAVAGLVVLAAGVFASGAPAAPPPVVVRATFDTSAVRFAEAIQLRVVVLLDATRVQPESLRIVEDVAPLTSLSPGRTTRATRGHTITVTLERTFSCLSSGCVSPTGDATPAFPPVKATIATLAGETLGTEAAWPVLHVRGRVSKADLARSRPPFRADTAPTPPSYRLGPSAVAWWLYGAAVVLALAAVALAVKEARGLSRRRRGEPTVDELERALRLAREAENRPPPDRRRALGLLARLLDARDRRLAGTASDLAWAEPEPERAAVATFVADVEREVPS